MAKTGKYVDLTIKREVSDSIRSTVISELTEYLKTESDPVVNFAASYLRDTFLSKYVDENTDSHELRSHRAIVKWLGVERRNERTNVRLFTTDPFFRGLGYGHVILNKAARLIERVIGRTPPTDLLEDGSFSGGATTSVKRGAGTLAAKFIGMRDVTPDAWPYVHKALAGCELWTALNPGLLTPRFVRGNVLFTVPKTAVIDRVACKEPDYNVFAQKAVGNFFRRQLRRKGIDLNDQSINRRLAREGSITGTLATIDLSSASDSLTTSLVSLLLPYEWFKLLDSLRSPKTFIDGRSHLNAMFSSMGNGFTFELESLVFWALAHVTRGTTRSYGRISVYGDDIIIPSDMAGVFIKLLHWVGFTTNASKTFVKGPFRESCGGHYYRGWDVTPFYLRRPIKDVSDLILFLNQLRRWIISTEMDAAEAGWEHPNRFVRLWTSLSERVPRTLRGGYDIASRTQLVSCDRSQCELLAATRRWEKTEATLSIGLYLTRLLAVDRNPDQIRVDAPFSSVTTPTNRWLIRRIKVRPEVFGLVRPLFLSEQWT